MTDTRAQAIETVDHSAATFKAIPDFPNYEINESGDVRNVKTGLILKQFLRGMLGRQYYTVTLCRQGYQKNSKIHRLVLFAHVGTPSADKPFCRHLDGNPYNNHLSNLKWGSASENQMDRVSHGTDARGEKNVRTTITNAEAADYIARYKSGESTAQISLSGGVSHKAIKEMVTPIGSSWRHLHTLPTPPQEGQ